MVGFHDGAIYDMSPLTKLGVCVKPTPNTMQLGEHVSTGNRWTNMQCLNKNSQM